MFESSKRNRARGSSNPESLSSLQLYLAGAGAGVGNSIISGPVEHIRIRELKFPILSTILKCAKSSEGARNFRLQTSEARRKHFQELGLR